MKNILIVPALAASLFFAFNSVSLAEDATATTSKEETKHECGCGCEHKNGEKCEHEGQCSKSGKKECADKHSHSEKHKKSTKK